MRGESYILILIRAWEDVKANRFWILDFGFWIDPSLPEPASAF
jgi:hypothetical protein